MVRIRNRRLVISSVNSLAAIERQPAGTRGSATFGGALSFGRAAGAPAGRAFFRRRLTGSVSELAVTGLPRQLHSSGSSGDRSRRVRRRGGACETAAGR